MRSARFLFAAFLVVGAAVVVSCTDRAGPTEPLSSARGGLANSVATDACKNLDGMRALIKSVWANAANGAGQVSAPLRELDDINDALLGLKNQKKADAPRLARNLVKHIGQRMKWFAAPGSALVPDLIAAIYCFIGMPQETFLIKKGNTATVLVIANSDGQGGIQLPANAVTENTLITLTVLSPASKPLITELDQYASYVDITQSSSVENSLTGPVVVAVCPSVEVPPEARPHLKLGHQSDTRGFEITVPASAAFLNCSTATASIESKLPGWVRSLVSLVLPKALYAGDYDLSGGVGGSATEFSPFGAVDTELSFLGGGGVGGSATEFLRAPDSSDSSRGAATGTEGATQKSRVKSSVELPLPGNCPSVAPGDAIAQKDCRPGVTITTRNGTLLGGVRVDWSVPEGDGGRVAVDNPASTTADCGVFGTTASTRTITSGELTGYTQACWRLGAAGPHFLTATPTSDGVPAGVTFLPTSVTFETTAVKIDQTITFAQLASKTYGDAPFQISATGGASGNPVTFAVEPATVCTLLAGNFVQILGAGTCTITASQAGNDKYNAATDVSQMLEIKRAPLTITTGSGTRIYGTANPTFSCDVTGAQNDESVTCIAASAATVTSPVGEYPVTGTLSGSYDNYFVETEIRGTLSVTRAPLTITTSSGTRYYGASDPVLACTVLGAQNGESVTCTAASAATVSSPVGEYPVIGTLSGSYDNYFVETEIHGTLSVTRAPLTITAGSGTRVYGTANPTFSCVVAGAQNGELVTCTAASAATVTSPVGEYPVTGTLSGSFLNYFVERMNGGTLIVQTHVQAQFENPTANAIRNGTNANDVPIHFSVSSANGGSIEGLTFTLSINSPVPISAASTSFTFDAPASYTWNKKWNFRDTGSVVGNTYTVTITFDDGTKLTGDIKIK